MEGHRRDGRRRRKGVRRRPRRRSKLKDGRDPDDGSKPPPLAIARLRCRPRPGRFVELRVLERLEGAERWRPAVESARATPPRPSRRRARLALAARPSLARDGPDGLAPQRAHGDADARELALDDVVLARADRDGRLERGLGRAARRRRALRGARPARGAARRPRRSRARPRSSLSGAGARSAGELCGRERVAARDVGALKADDVLRRTRPAS